MKTQIETLKIKRNPAKPTDTGNTRREAIARGLCYEGFAALCGYSYHRTLEAAEKATSARARKACPSNPPCWSVAKLQLEETATA